MGIGNDKIIDNLGSSVISSFFGVFTEITLDNGQTWSGVVNPTHLELSP